jgi:uncharacterized protein (DUF1697 family)
MSGATAPEIIDVEKKLEEGLQARFGVDMSGIPAKRNQLILKIARERMNSKTLGPEQRAEYVEIVRLMERVDDLDKDEMSELRMLTQKIMIRVLERPKKKKTKSTPPVPVAPTLIAPPAPNPALNPTSTASAPGKGMTLLSPGTPPELQAELEQLFVDWEYATWTYEFLEKLSLGLIVEVLEKYEELKERILEMQYKLVGKHFVDHLGARMSRYILIQGVENMERLGAEKSPKALLYKFTDRLEEFLEEEWPFPKEVLVEIEENEFKDLNPFFSGKADEDHYNTLSGLMGDLKLIINCRNVASKEEDFSPEKDEFYQGFAILYLRRLNYTYGKKYGDTQTPEIITLLDELNMQIEADENQFGEYFNYMII